MKTAAKSHTLSAKYIAGFHAQAARQGLEAMLIIEIGDYRITGIVERM